MNEDYQGPEDNTLESELEPTKLDYTLETPEERVELVAKIIEEIGEDKVTPRYLEIMTDYIIFAMDKEERRSKKILTENRANRIGVRETSFQGLVDRLENGEDGIYNMIANDKGIIFSPKVEITQADIDEIPPLKELVAAIEDMKKLVAAATGKQKFSLNQSLIAMYKDQYVIKNAYKPVRYSTNLVKSCGRLDLSENVTVDKDKNVHSDGQITLFDPLHVSLLLCNYTKLKEDSWGDFEYDLYYLMDDLETATNKALEDYPMYKDLLICKIDGMKNEDIQSFLLEKHGTTHSLEYLSALWRNKIPKIISDRAIDDYLGWYYKTVEKDEENWKTCTRCGESKVSHTRFFSKNQSSKDGFYSICKQCRNKKNKK